MKSPNKSPQPDGFAAAGLKRYVAQRMKSRRGKMIWVGCLLSAGVIYFSMPFAFLPLMLADTDTVSADDFTLHEVFDYMYTPMLQSLDEGNPYLIIWKKYSMSMCRKYEGRCTNMSENGSNDKDAT